MQVSEEFRAKLVEDYPPPRMFALISWGCAATNWIARTLNSHPEVFCVHTAANLWSMMTGNPRVSGVDYMRLVGMMGTGNTAAGDIHGLSSDEVPALRAAYPGFVAAVVQRHPYARLRSALALWDRMGWENRTLGPVTEALDIPLQDKREAEMALSLNHILSEQHVGVIFRSEDLTKEAASLRALVDLISGGAAEVSDDWLRYALGRPAQNRHIGCRERADRDIIALAERYMTEEARQAYIGLGYALG